MARARKQKAKPDYRISWFLLTLAVLSFGFGAWAAINGALTLQWPRVAAEIVDANLTLREREARDGGQADRLHTFGVHYKYQVGGRTYIGSGIEPYDLNMQNSAGAVKMANTYRIGSIVQIAYDPKDPSEAYLMPGPSSFSLMLLGIGVAFALVGLLARRMIRVGPGDPDDEKPAPAKQKPRVELDPAIASFYPKKEGTQPQP